MNKAKKEKITKPTCTHRIIRNILNKILFLNQMEKTMNKDYNYIKIEKKWQNKWYKDKLYETKKEKKRKFFIHFAYPGVSGYLHVGHMRGFTYCDIIARYKRMTGYDVLFPAGFHASGIPSIGFAKKIQRGDADTIKILKENGCTDEEIEKLKNPLEVVRYFSKIYVKDYWKRFGFLIDYDRLMNTISEGYKKFITWQFHKLNEKNLLIQKPHYAPFCPNCGPVAVDKSETDVSKGGSAEILEFTVIKFRLKDGVILPAATLRPETIFGVTNLWVHPEVVYEKIKLDDEVWVCSSECRVKLQAQFSNVQILEERIPGSTLVGKTCVIPLVNREAPILPGVFVDPNIATGIVMSVPAHAPYDYIALIESGEKIEPVTIITGEGLTSNPAKTICEQLGIKSQNEKEKLNEATEILYKKEFHTGYLNDKCLMYSGIKISDIKDTVKNDLIQQKNAAIMREFSEEVICRCGERVIIKQIPDQWFIKYSDPDLTKKAVGHSQRMNIYPDEYKSEIPKVLEWFGDRAVIRKGSWLGTEFPFKEGWIIEPISDSTLYPMYYIISYYINKKLIKPEDLTLEFFDYVFLGKGEPMKPIWKRIREDYRYYYPVDINLGGKEHKTVHFPVFLMNHVAILPEDAWPKGIFVHWWVTQKGKEKISKSKGGAEPIVSAATMYGVDAMRLYYAHVGSPFVDVEWDPEVVVKYKNRLTHIYSLIKQIKNYKTHRVNTHIDSWLQSTLNRCVLRVNKAFENYDIRSAANDIFFEFFNDMQWYLKRDGCNKKILREVLEKWIRLMCPFTPHLAEEMHSLLGGEPYVSNDPYPTYDQKMINKETEIGEYIISRIMDDINEIIKVTSIKPSRIYVYTTPSWKQKITRTALDLHIQGSLDMSLLMRNIMNDKNFSLLNKQEIAQYAQKLVSDIKKMNDTDRERLLVDINEKEYLENAKSFLEKVFTAEVSILDADDQKRYDPSNKAKHASPLRPAIYIE